MTKETQLLKMKEEKQALQESTLLDLLKNMEDLKALETMGKELKEDELRIILSLIAKQTLPQSRLGPIFVGLPFATFHSLLENIESHELIILQQISPQEPVYHQLLLLSHYFETFLNENIQKYDILAESIQKHSFKEVTSKEIHAIRQEIDELKAQIMDNLKLINTGLTLAWTSGQKTLIDSLSHSKERLYHLANEAIGYAKDEQSASSGLYKILETQLEKVFGDSDGFEALKEEDSPLEALAMLGAWHLKDYWELGLLPKIKTENELKEILDSQDVNVAAFYRAAVEKQLAELGLKNIKAFKDKGMISKPLLIEFLKNQRSLPA